MRVLFTHSYFLHLDKKQLGSNTPFPPLATLYAASLLRKNGFEVGLADLQFATTPREIGTHLENFKPDVLVIYDDAFNYLTKMCLTNMREAAFTMQELAKAAGAKVIVSSSDATDHLQKYFSRGADYIIIGEGEQTLLELLSALLTNNIAEISSIKGLARYSEGKLVTSAPRPVLKDLDELPAPAWDLVNIAPYKSAWLKHHGYFTINFVTTRGCPYKCNWCAKPIYGNRYNSHSPGRVVQQLKTLQEQFGFTHVWFADDIFGLKPGWLKDFSKACKMEGLQIEYKIQSRADLLLEDENIRYLAESGCKEVWMGAESGSQKILDAMDKGTTVEQVAQATGLLKKHGIKPCFFLQFGYPGETMEDIQNTVNMLKELEPYDLGISVSYPLPGTVFYEKVKAEMKSKQNWRDSDDLQIMFNSTYQAEFYRVLQRFVHYQFRLRQGLQDLHNRRLTKRSLLTAYYLARKAVLKTRLKQIEPDAGGRF